MKDDGVHENFFTVPELPYKKKEREAILLLKQIIDTYNEHIDCISDGCSLPDDLEDLLINNKDLVDWVMKYKGE